MVLAGLRHFGDARRMNRIKELRELAGLSQEALAEKANTSAQQISRLEKSERKLNEDWMRRLAPHLGVRPHELMVEATPASTPGCPRFVDDPQELAILAFFEPIPFEHRKRAFEVLKAFYASDTDEPAKVENDR